MALQFDDFDDILASDPQLRNGVRSECNQNGLGIPI
eukprot:SAG31_NODE_261_length_18904_cov_115.315554_6_plen_36_part_00